MPRPVGRQQLITVTWSGRLLSRTKFTAVIKPLKPPPTIAMLSGADFGTSSPKEARSFVRCKRESQSTISVLPSRPEQQRDRESDTRRGGGRVPRALSRRRTGTGSRCDHRGGSG